MAQGIISSHDDNNDNSYLTQEQTELKKAIEELHKHHGLTSLDLKESNDIQITYQRIFSDSDYFYSNAEVTQQPPQERRESICSIKSITTTTDGGGESLSSLDPSSELFTCPKCCKTFGR